MTQHIAPSYAAPAPGRRARRWALAPVITTILAVPASALLVICGGLSPMALDSCESSAACPEAAAAIERAWQVSLFTLIPVFLVWMWPRSSRFTAARWLTAAAYVGMAVYAFSLFGSIPSGR